MYFVSLSLKLLAKSKSVFNYLMAFVDFFRMFSEWTDSRASWRTIFALVDCLRSEVVIPRPMLLVMSLTDSPVDDSV